MRAFLLGASVKGVFYDDAAMVGQVGTVLISPSRTITARTFLHSRTHRFPFVPPDDRWANEKKEDSCTFLRFLHCELQLQSDLLS